MARDPGARLCDPANSQAPPNLTEREHRTLFLSAKNGFCLRQLSRGGKALFLKPSHESSELSGSPPQLLYIMEGKDSVEVDDKSLVDVGQPGKGGAGLSTFIGVGGDKQTKGNSNKKSPSTAGGAVSNVTAKAKTGAATATATAAAAAPMQAEVSITVDIEHQARDDTGEESSSDEAAPTTGGAAAALPAKGAVVASKEGQRGGVAGKDDAGARGSITLSKSDMDSVAEEIRRQASSESYR